MHKAAQILGIEEFLDRKPRNLSGGQRQRVAMGRAIVREPSAFLMDEPLSNLDAKLRVQMRAEIARIQRDLATTTIYVPDAVFASPTSLLTTLAVGDQVFINAYLLATTVFARQGDLMGSKFARYTAEIMATEAVHRALALQSLGRLGNDRVYAKFGQREAVTGLPTTGAGGFYKILEAVKVLESAGFGFGKPGSKPGTKYEYAEVAARTPTDPGVNTIRIS